MGDQLNPELIQERKYICTVVANDLQHAYTRTNNNGSPDMDINWITSEARSTSIGDIIYDLDAKEPWIVLPIGFVNILHKNLGCELYLEDEPLEGDYPPDLEYPQ